MSSMHLYAELLQHIQSVTFFASLQSEHNHETKVQLSANNEWITLSHEGQNASMRLPTKIGGGGDAALTLPAAPSRDITLRLRLEETSPGLLQFRDHASGNIEPWTAEALGKDTEVYCCQCGQLFISRGRVQTWKDLPSENWAEMMDFWHCHKPSEEQTNGHEDVAARKGYAASNKLQAQRGTGFVNISYFLLASTDCAGIEVKQSNNESNVVPSSRLLHCDCCDAEIGRVDDHAEGWRIYKWAVSVALDDRISRTSFPLEKWVSSRILTYVENESVRHFHIHGDFENSQAASLLLWIFTPDISFSSSVKADNRHDPTLAIKVMWQTQPTSADGDGQFGFRYESLALPVNVLTSIQKALKDSQELIPPSSRTFNKWNVGLLHRFSNNEI